MTCEAYTVPTSKEDVMRLFKEAGVYGGAGCTASKVEDRGFRSQPGHQAWYRTVSAGKKEYGECYYHAGSPFSCSAKNSNDDGNLCRCAGATATTTAKPQASTVHTPTGTARRAFKLRRPFHGERPSRELCAYNARARLHCRSRVCVRVRAVGYVYQAEGLGGMQRPKQQAPTRLQQAWCNGRPRVVPPTMHRPRCVCRVRPQRRQWLLSTVWHQSTSRFQTPVLENQQWQRRDGRHCRRGTRTWESPGALLHQR